MIRSSSNSRIVPFRQDAKLYASHAAITLQLAYHAQSWHSATEVTTPTHRHMQQEPETGRRQLLRHATSFLEHSQAVRYPANLGYEAATAIIS
jgi:hypothetical protein